MAEYYQAEDNADLVTVTLNELGRNRFTDLMSKYMRTIAMKRLMKKKKMTFKAGPEIEFRVITDTNGSFRFTGIGQVDQVDIPNVMDFGKIPWRHATWNYAWDKRFLAMNSSPAKIVDYIKTQRIAALGDAIKGLEVAFWRVPDEDGPDAFGIPVYLVKNNTEGYEGTVPSGWSAVANLSPTQYARWRNWTAQYTDPTEDDLIVKIRKAFEYTDFNPLVDEVPTYNLGDDYGLYTNYATLGPLERLLDHRNDNLGTDLAKHDGKVMIRRTPVVFVLELDEDTTNPVYGINWGVTHCVGLRGWYMNETVIDRQPGQHTMGAVHTDLTYNLICHDRRQNFVLATNTGLPA